MQCEQPENDPDIVWIAKILAGLDRGEIPKEGAEREAWAAALTSLRNRIVRHSYGYQYDQQRYEDRLRWELDQARILGPLKIFAEEILSDLDRCIDFQRSSGGDVFVEQIHALSHTLGPATQVLLRMIRSHVQARLLVKPSQRSEKMPALLPRILPGLPVGWSWSAVDRTYLHPQRRETFLWDARQEPPGLGYCGYSRSLDVLEQTDCPTDVRDLCIEANGPVVGLLRSIVALSTTPTAEI